VPTSLDLETADTPAEPAVAEGVEPAAEAVPETDDQSDTIAGSPEEEVAAAAAPVTGKEKPQRRSRRRSSTGQATELDEIEAAGEQSASMSGEPDTDESPVTVEPAQEPLTDHHEDDEDDEDDEDLPNNDMAAWVSDDLSAADDYDDYDEDDEDDEDEDEEWDDDTEDSAVPLPPREDELEILPLESLLLQKPCYLVVDRLSELITCPLKEFGELGLIPVDEEQARTLPVFDNHRVARRFARRNQRIIKVPNGKMLNKTQSYLQAKGITRLLFDGHVYALN